MCSRLWLENIGTVRLVLRWLIGIQSDILSVLALPMAIGWDWQAVRHQKQQKGFWWSTWKNSFTVICRCKKNENISLSGDDLEGSPLLFIHLCKKRWISVFSVDPPNLLCDGCVGYEIPQDERAYLAVSSIARGDGKGASNTPPIMESSRTTSRAPSQWQCFNVIRCNLFSISTKAVCSSSSKRLLLVVVNLYYLYYLY